MSLSDKLKGVEINTKFKLRPEVLLCPQIPKPIHGVNPRTVLGQDWWDKTRQAAYASTGYCCVACGVYKKQALVKQWLEGHELYSIDYYKGTMTYVETVPLCHLCHNFIHVGRLDALLAAGLINAGFFDQVLKHGYVIINKHGLKLPRVHNGRVAKWSAWRLVIDNVVYPPKFKNEREWLRHYGGLNQQIMED